MNKVRHIYLYICLALIVLAGAGLFVLKPFSAAAEEQDYTGTGTSDDPYKIYTAAGLYELLGNGNTAHLSECFELMGSIDLSGICGENVNGEGEKSWTPIGNRNNPFSGTFNGGGFDITNLYINAPDDDYQGLFGYNSGIIEYLGVSGNVTGGDDVGGVVGDTAGVVSNCHYSGNVKGKGSIGGIVGYNAKSTISYCYNYGDITGIEDEGGGDDDFDLPRDYRNYSGGIVGFNDGTTSYCYNEGNISGINYAGGIAGENYHAISNCYNTGSVKGKENCTGGITGYTRNSSATVSYCYNTGNVSGGEKVGGIAGYNLYGSVLNCYFLKNEIINSTLEAIADGTSINTTYKNDEEFTSGEVAWLLQSRQSGSVWGQTLPTDTYPVLKAFDSNAERVYKVEFKDETGSEVLDTKYFNGTLTELPDVTSSTPAGQTAEWWTEKTGAGSKYTVGSTLDKDLTLYLYLRLEESSYTVTITSYKDDSLWNSGAPSYKLSSDEGSTFITDLTDVPNGVYSIYNADDDTDTGVIVTVEDDDAAADVYYYTVTFYDGTEALDDPAPQVVVENGKVTKPADPSKTGAVFSKWVTENGGSTEFDFTATPITETTSIYASWTDCLHEVAEWHYVNDDNHSGECSKCGEPITEEHSGGIATCTEKAVCEVCGERYGDLKEHTFVNGFCEDCEEPDPDYQGSETTPPPEEPDDPSETEPSETDPSETEPSVTEPPVTEPSVTEPPVTEPSVTEPSETEPSVTEPSVTEPSVTEPSVTEPSVTEPPVTEPVATETAPTGIYDLISDLPGGGAPGAAPAGTSSAMEKLLEMVTNANDGDVITIDLTGNTSLSKAVLNAASGRDITIIINVGKGVFWRVNGRDIEKSRKVDLGVRLNSKVATADEINELAGSNKTIKFTLRHSGDLGFTGYLNIPVNDRYNGMYANLYYYSSSGEFDLVGSVMISGDYAEFPFTHASDYVIVIDSKAHGEILSGSGAENWVDEVTADAGIYADTDIVGETVPVIGVIVPIAVSLTLILKKKKSVK